MRKLVSLDVETCGLDPENCDLIEVGAVIDDLDDIKTRKENRKRSSNSKILKDVQIKKPSITRGLFRNVRGYLTGCT